MASQIYRFPRISSLFPPSLKGKGIRRSIARTIISNSSACKPHEFLRITNNKDIINFQYSIQNSQIREAQQAKYLGVALNNKLTWSDHIHITKKGNSSYGFIQQNFNTCPTNIKSSLYLSLIRPILEYACTIWSPHCKNDIQLIEAVQRRTARFAVNCYSRNQSVTTARLAHFTRQKKPDEIDNDV